MSKKIIHILHVILSLDVGGAERVVNHLMTCQPQDQLRQTVCCLDRIGQFGEKLRNKGYKVELLLRRPGVDWSLVHRLRIFCKANKIDLLHTHGESPWFYGVLAANLIPWNRIPCITTIHGYGGGDRQKLTSYRLWRILTLLSKKVVFVSRVFEEELIAAGLPTNKVTTIVNGVETISIDGRNVATPLKKQYNIAPDDFVIGIIARLSPIKNHALLFQAVARITSRANRKIRVLIVGHGPERKNLEQLVQKLSLNHIVLFCGEHPDVTEFYSLFDVFVLPSFSEGISMTILEAMAAGIPVIASAVGGNIEIITHGENGLLFPANDLEALVQVLLSMMEDSTLADKLVRKAHRRLQTSFSMGNMLTAYLRLYKELLH